MVKISFLIEKDKIVGRRCARIVKEKGGNYVLVKVLLMNEKEIPKLFVD